MLGFYIIHMYDRGSLSFKSIFVNFCNDNI